MPYLLSPNGVRIVGTYERLYGCTSLNEDTLVPGPGNTFDFRPDGDAIVYQSTAISLRSEHSGQRLFVDEEGEHHEERNLTLHDDAGRVITYQPPPSLAKVEGLTLLWTLATLIDGKRVGDLSPDNLKALAGFVAEHSQP